MSTADRPAPAQGAVYAPGLRVEIRGAEWVIKRADLTSSGTYSLLVTGISELVRGREARFLTEIDRDIKPLLSEDTELVPNTSPRFANARLYLESLLRQAPPTTPTSGSVTAPPSTSFPINSTPHCKRSNRSGTASC